MKKWLFGIGTVIIGLGVVAVFRNRKTVIEPRRNETIAEAIERGRREFEAAHA